MGPFVFCFLGVFLHCLHVFLCLFFVAFVLLLFVIAFATYHLLCKLSSPLLLIIFIIYHHLCYLSSPLLLIVVFVAHIRHTICHHCCCLSLPYSSIPYACRHLCCSSSPSCSTLFFCSSSPYYLLSPTLLN